MPSKTQPLRARLRQLPWKIVAKIVSRPWFVNRLISKGMSRPYSHIKSADPETEGQIYMYRYWIFNPYNGTRTWFESMLNKVFKNLPSFRLHHIMLPDTDCFMHDHPWDARTIILRNFYIEERLVEDGDMSRYDTEYRRAGDTAPILFKQYHKIAMVSSEGTWTLFISFKYMGTWGFLVNGEKIPYYDYHKDRAA